MVMSTYYLKLYSVRSLSGVNWADLMAVQGAFGIDFYDRSILRPNSIVPTIVLVDLL